MSGGSKNPANEPCGCKEAEPGESARGGVGSEREPETLPISARPPVGVVKLAPPTACGRAYGEESADFHVFDGG